MPTTDQTPLRIAVLGSTGSIGRQTRAVVEHCNAIGPHKRFEIVGLCAGSDAKTLFEQADAMNVRELALCDDSSSINDSGRNLRRGACAARRLIEDTQPDLVVGAIVGIAGLDSTLYAAEQGIDIALANKESLVAGGKLVIDAARKSGSHILPVDSEHAGVWQCLLGLLGRGYTPPTPIDNSIARITLTASGGSLREWPVEDLANATPSDALNHPNWSMGAKVTIDSATLMNKGLELIEAHWLFGVDADKLDAIIHPQSIVHAFVECTDGSIIAQLGAPDMHCPIQHALCYPDRTTGVCDRLDLSTLSTLDFEPIDHARFPAVRMALNAIQTGGTAGAILNAANEITVDAFLNEQIRFGQMTEIVHETINAVRVEPNATLAAVLSADTNARDHAKGLIGVRAGGAR
ncbi:MAG: 1-deoxy-D-xylulose-5-phosphate reductoisomerase [Phycisphaerales bacterium]|nr:1-deoxy-D-xylulose-5-phosphate reductoisomerase [Phycisphaerales bacterium]